MQQQPILDNFRVSPCMIHIFISVTSSMWLHARVTHRQQKRYHLWAGGMAGPRCCKWSIWRSIWACFCRTGVAWLMWWSFHFCERWYCRGVFHDCIYFYVLGWLFTPGERRAHWVFQHLEFLVKVYMMYLVGINCCVLELCLLSILPCFDLVNFFPFL